MGEKYGYLVLMVLLCLKPLDSIAMRSSSKLRNMVRQDDDFVAVAHEIEKLFDNLRDMDPNAVHSALDNANEKASAAITKMNSEKAPEYLSQIKPSIAAHFFIPKMDKAHVAKAFLKLKPDTLNGIVRELSSQEVSSIFRRLSKDEVSGLLKSLEASNCVKVFKDFDDDDIAEWLEKLEKPKVKVIFAKMEKYKAFQILNEMKSPDFSLAPATSEKVQLAKLTLSSMLPQTAASTILGEKVEHIPHIAGALELMKPIKAAEILVALGYKQESNEIYPAIMKHMDESSALAILKLMDPISTAKALNAKNSPELGCVFLNQLSWHEKRHEVLRYLDPNLRSKIDTCLKNTR